MKFKNLLGLTILTFCFSSVQIFACLQASGNSVVGKGVTIERVSVDTFMKEFLTHADRAYWEKVLADLEVQKKTEPNIGIIEIRNNRAVALVHLGRIQEAIEILKEIERQKPDEYLTAANLGTAYELNGENQKALDWIKEGIKRKEESHRGTEWLHVKILEAKLAIEKDPNWLKTNSVLGLDFSRVQKTPDEKTYMTDSSGKQRWLPKIEEALIYQLHERLEFVKAPEPIVADLLFDLSKVFAVSRTPQHAKAVNELAVNYAANLKELEKGRTIKQDEVIETDKQNKVVETGKQNYYYYAIPAIAALLLIGFIYVFFRKRNFR